MPHDRFFTCTAVTVKLPDMRPENFSGFVLDSPRHASYFHCAGTHRWRVLTEIKPAGPLRTGCVI
jgi:hypothetical protein